MKDVLIKASWFEQIKNAPEEIQKELFYRIIKLGVFEEDIDISKDDWAIADSWKNLSGNITRMQNAHAANVEFGKTHGRQMVGDPQQIYDYLQQHPKAKVAEVALALGLPEKPSAKGAYGYLYDNPGWKNRKITNWSYENVKIFTEQNSDSVKNITISNSEIVKNITESENQAENFYEKKNSDSEISFENSGWKF